MAPQDGEKPSTWDQNVEFDLTMAAWLSSCGGEPKPAWAEVHQKMKEWGYTFSKDALTQRWSKKVYKEFKERHPVTASSSAAETNNGHAADGEATPAKRKRAPARPKKKSKDNQTDADAGEDELEADAPKAKKSARRPRAKVTAAAKKKNAKQASVEDAAAAEGDEEQVVGVTATHEKVVNEKVAGENAADEKDTDEKGIDEEGAVADDGGAAT